MNREQLSSSKAKKRNDEKKRLKRFFSLTANAFSWLAFRKHVRNEAVKAKGKFSECF